VIKESRNQDKNGKGKAYSKKTYKREELSSFEYSNSYFKIISQHVIYV
jgi:hypothetical protein